MGTELVVIVFEQAETASNVMRELDSIRRTGGLRLVDAAVISKDIKGKQHTREIQDVSSLKGTLVGAIGGGLVGILGGPVGIVIGVAVGAILGGFVAGRLDLGFTNRFLGELQDKLKADHSVLMVLIEPAWTATLIQELEKHPGKLFRHTTRAEILSQLSAEQNI